MKFIGLIATLIALTKLFICGSYNNDEVKELFLTTDETFRKAIAIIATDAVLELICGAYIMFT